MKKNRDRVKRKNVRKKQKRKSEKRHSAFYYTKKRFYSEREVK